ncbi:SMI1/KNR4 family protein [Commensalibacter communis]|uniref:SMI1/KNR4 family protein n=1 Tax=Commensalibacter communis TaxID=2972786 RepID=UPI00232D8C79|nr:SMI1/KNR4 family protein [Commensalibacter communis]
MDTKNKEHDDEVETGQPVDLTTIQQAETILGISFPNSYKIFLQHFGWLGMGGGAGLSGVFPNQVDTSGDVVCFIKYLRDDIDLPHHFIALEFDEGDLVLCIDYS